MEKCLLVTGLTLWLAVSLSHQDTSAACASVNTGAVTPKIPLPGLPTTAFKSIIRADIINKNTTVEATEYVDESVNRATIKMISQGTTSLYIIAYDNNEVYSVGGFNDEKATRICTTQSMQQNTTALFGISTLGSGSQHLISTSRILSFMNGTEVYKGRTYIDGIPVNHWSSCVFWPELNSNFALEYYFTIPNWMTPNGLDQIPVQAEVQGTTTAADGTTHTFHHVYQYVNFEPYVQDPETIFDTPPGVFCANRKDTRPIPAINNHYYYREEIITPDSGSGPPMVSSNDIWYDFDLQLIRYDTRDAPDGMSQSFVNSVGPYRVIHDFSTGVQYAIAMDLNRCSMDPIPVGAQGFDGVYNATSKTMGMRGPYSFLNLNSSTYLYAGIRDCRGVKCDVFQAVLDTIPGFTTVVYEVYFLTGALDITDKGSSTAETLKATPMRILIWQDGTLANQYEIHNFDQYSANSNSFDVSACFPGRNSVNFEMFVTADNYDPALMPQVAPYVNVMLDMQIVTNSGISPVRLQRTRLHWGKTEMYYEGTLLGVTPAFAKYRQFPGQSMTQGLGKAIQNVLTPQDCASACDTLEEWSCVQFDYCSFSKVCTLGKKRQMATLYSNPQCVHYQRVLGGGFNTQVGLQAAWSLLKDQVFGGQVSVVVPLPDENGVIDVSVDFSKLDDTQKMVLRAYDIRNEVVGIVERQMGNSIYLKQFIRTPNKVGKGYVDVIHGVSVDDCASDCVAEQTYKCKSFHYCWEAGTCFLSKINTDQHPDSVQASSACDLYYRDYTSDYQLFQGLTVLSSSTTVFQSVPSDSQCAKMCTNYNTFHCESFDYCIGSQTCYLGKTHFYDTPKTDVKQVPDCVHFSRNYINDFVAKTHKQIHLRDNRVVQDVSPQQCAKLCVQESSFTCNTFDYCANFSECRLSDASVSQSGQTTFEATAYCDVYIRQYSSGPKPPAALTAGSSSSSSDKVYSTGAMAGLAMAMAAIGIGLGFLILLVYNKFFGGTPQSGGDGMTIQFSKKDES